MEQLSLQSKIHTIRNVQVMLDYDLAALYEVSTKQLNLAVKRNSERFPDDFMFQLTLEEWNALRFQFETSNTRGGRRYAPYAFTEQGLAMLSGILNSPVAIQVNIAIMRTFVAIRQSIMPLGSNSNMKQIENKIMVLEAVSEETLAALNDLSEDTRKEFDDIYIALSEMADKQKQITKPRRKIGYIQDTEEEKL
ncbi:MAG TPA: ORF6N domain-containing protein [Paludibacteraceae bacterium]|nr:ORF6N domain-containing protein [Paludibacteraceae bacterium]